MTEEQTEGKSLDQELAGAQAKIEHMEKVMSELQLTIQRKDEYLNNIVQRHRKVEQDWKNALAPLADAVWEIIIEGDKFDGIVKDIVYDKVRDMLDDRDFSDKVTDVVAGMEFQIAVR